MSILCCEALDKATVGRDGDIRYYPDDKRFIITADGIGLDYCPFCKTQLDPEPYVANYGTKPRHCCHTMDGMVRRKRIIFHRKRKKLPKYVFERRGQPLNNCAWCLTSLS